MPDHVVVGYCHGGSVRAEFCASLLGVLRHRGAVVDEVIAVGSGPNISRARNMIVAGFLEDHAAPWLLMCDTDMSFPADTAARLIAAADPAGRPVVGALCFAENPGGEPAPVMYELAEQDGFTVFARLPSWPEDGLVRVTATGAACLLVHRSVLETVAKGGDTAAPWFRESVIGSSLVGEDLTFCLRCGVAGIPVHVHTGIRAGHVKARMI